MIILMQERNYCVLDWCITVKRLRTGHIWNIQDMKEKGILIQAAVQINLLITKIRKIVKESGWQLDQEFNFEQVKFDLPIRY